MRFNFEVHDGNRGGDRREQTPSSSTSKEELEWLPLHKHPVFASTNITGTTAGNRSQTNLLAWDGASRLYFWDLNNQCLHRISIRLGEPDPTSVLAASPTKVLQADVELDFVVDRISINRQGSALVLAGSDGLRVMFLYGRASSKDSSIICSVMCEKSAPLVMGCHSSELTLVCNPSQNDLLKLCTNHAESFWTISIGSEIYFNSNNGIRTLRVSWHPYSDTHLGVLSSDSVFRLFDLSSTLEQPEQEYYLQPVERGRSRNASSICPVDFSFGGDHLWDRFSVFILFSDGAVFILCPVVPFGSVFKWESVLEMYSDAHTFGLKSSSPKAVNNSSMAISWLESTFPELAQEGAEGRHQTSLKAKPYALFDASVSLQGPLRKVCQRGEENSEIKAAECEGCAVSFLYNSVSKDSVLVTAWSGGQLQIDALGDEIQPVWSLGSPPRLRVDLHDHILGIAMICESVSTELPILTLDQSPNHTVWLGQSPPLLRLAIVDLALPRRKESDSLISMFVDPLIPERIYSIHDGGIDSIVLHFLPFTSQIIGMDETMRTPSVHSVLSTCQGEYSSPSPLCGFVALSDSFGYSWIVGLTSGCECIVLEMETWNQMLPAHAEKETKPTNLEEPEPAGISTIISKDLLSGPRVVLAPPSSAKPVSADSIEGRSALHQYFKLFHENYVEYAHKVYFELKNHGPHLKKIIDVQHARLREAEEKLSGVEGKQEKIENRIDRAVQMHTHLEQRLLNLRKLIGDHKKPLSRAEREFKMELDRFKGVELDALRASIKSVDARLKRHSASPQKKMIPNRPRQIPRRMNHGQEDEMSKLKASLEKLSLVNSENTQKVKLVDAALKSRDSTS